MKPNKKPNIHTQLFTTKYGDSNKTIRNIDHYYKIGKARHFLWRTIKDLIIHERDCRRVRGAGAADADHAQRCDHDDNLT